MKGMFLVVAAAFFCAGIGATENAETVRFSPKAISPRLYEIGKNPTIPLIVNGKVAFEVTHPAHANAAVKFAAQELASFLGQIAGMRINVTDIPSGKVPLFRVGDKAVARKLGLEIDHLDRDGFFIRSNGNEIIIVGNDEDSAKPAENARFGERGTLYGVYEFLERFGGVRFYFPGKYGTIVPCKSNWSLPTLNIADRPDHQYRNIYYADVKTIGPQVFYAGMEGSNIMRLNKLRMRDSTLNMPNAHGFGWLGLARRFAKSHPEYFALKTNGIRCDGSTKEHHEKNGHICLNSEGVKNEIYLDAVAMQTGKPASSRDIVLPNGKSIWFSSSHCRPFFNLMPADSHYPCQCPKCKPIYNSGDPQKISDFIWDFVIDIAERLKANHIPGYATTMAYAQYKLIPSRKIPDNIIVMLALSGPWNEHNLVARERDEQLLRDWNKKLGAKTYLWTYPTKCGNAIPDVPNFTPRCVGTFFKRNAPYIFGSFVESQSDYWLYGFMNYYVVSKIMWNNSIDVDALMDEHFKLMYGASAPQLKEIYGAWEKHWSEEIMSNIRETAIGPQAVLPSRYDIWNKIYSPTEIGRINALFDTAEDGVTKDKESLGRIRFIRTELWGNVLKGAENYRHHCNDKSAMCTYMPLTTEKIFIDGKLDEPAWKSAPAVWMVPSKGGSVEVNTRVKLLADKENFYVGFECEEPHTKNMADVRRNFDDINMWKDNLVEIFFAGKPSDSHYYQMMLTSSGGIADTRNVGKILDPKWNSALEYKSGVVPDKMWVAEVRIPRKAFPEIEGNEFRANFTRGRQLNIFNCTIPYYVWVEFPTHTPENMGAVVIGMQPTSGTLLKDGDFLAPVFNKRFLGKERNWVSAKVIHSDPKIFRFGGASLRLDQDSQVVRQFLPKALWKEGATYKLSYYVRLGNVASNMANAAGFDIMLRFGSEGRGHTFHAHPQALTGTINWIRFEHTFKAPFGIGKHHEPFISINLTRSSGTAWVDHIELTEVK